MTAKISRLSAPPLSPPPFLDHGIPPARLCQGVITGLLLACISLLTTQRATAQLTVKAPEQLSTVSGSPNTPPDGNSEEAVLPPNGDFVVFSSTASNLLGAGNDTNNARDLFLRKSGSTTITRLSVTSQGKEMVSDSPEVPPNAPLFPAVSRVLSDDTFGVTFASAASNLLPEGITNPTGSTQIYLRIPKLEKTVLISRATNGIEGGNGPSTKSSIAALTGPNRFRIVFSSSATNLLPTTLRPPPSGEPVGPTTFNSRLYIADVSVNGSEINVLISDGTDGETPGDFYEPAISGNGQYVACAALSNVLGRSQTSQIIRFDLEGRVADLISRSDGIPGDGDSNYPSISSDGKVVAFSTRASNLGLNVPLGQPKFVLWNAAEDSLEIINKTADGTTGNGTYIVEGPPPYFPIGTISSDGRFAVWSDTASNLVAGDTNGVADVFLKDLKDGTIRLLSTLPSGAQFDSGSFFPSIGATSFLNFEIRTVFQSRATNRGTVFPDPQKNENVSRVFGAMTLREPPVVRNAPIDLPPAVIVKGKTVTLSFIKFRLPSLRLSQWASAVTVELQRLMAAATSRTVRYDVRIQNVKTKKNIRLFATRNRITLRKIDPGTYRVKYRAIATTSKNKTISTRFSPLKKFTVK